jgi:hypothetical protein
MTTTPEIRAEAIEDIRDMAEKGAPYYRSVMRQGRVSHEADSDVLTTAVTLIWSINLNRWPQGPIRDAIRDAREAAQAAATATAREQWQRVDADTEYGR